MKVLSTILFIIPHFLLSQVVDTDSLDNYMVKLMDEYKMPGLAIGVIHDGNILYKKGYGVTSNVDGLPIDTQTLFPILSCTKAFTATCLGILVDQGKLDWNDKVLKYLPDFKLSDPWITKELTISDLLSHRSGLREFDGDLLWYGTNYSTDEVIKKIQFYPIKGSFRLDFNYNNVMYLVAGKIVEKVSGLTWREFLKANVFDPLEMNNSSSTFSELIATPNHASPHIANKPIEPRSLDNAAAAGGINSTVDDMLLWLQLCLNKGKLHNKKIISEKTFQIITSSKQILDAQGYGSYGFGWYIDNEDSQKVFYHGGGMPGYKSIVAIYPEQSTGIVVLTNKISMINEGLINMISTYIRYPERTDWSNNRKYFTYFGYSWDTPESIDIAPNIPNDFSQYMGHYEDKVYGQAAITMINSDAILELLPSKGLLSGKLYRIDEYRFRIKFKDEFLPVGEVVFQFDKRQNITGFILDMPNDDFNFDNLDFKKTATDGNNVYKK